MIPAKWNRHNDGKWVDCFLLKVEQGHYDIDCIIAVETEDGNGLEMCSAKNRNVRIKRTRISLTKDDSNG